MHNPRSWQADSRRGYLYLYLNDGSLNASTGMDKTEVHPLLAEIAANKNQDALITAGRLSRCPEFLAAALSRADADWFTGHFRYLGRQTQPQLVAPECLGRVAPRLREPFDCASRISLSLPPVPTFPSLISSFVPALIDLRPHSFSRFIDTSISPSLYLYSITTPLTQPVTRY